MHKDFPKHIEKLLKPYYQDEYVTLYQGNALELLRYFDSDTFDAIITDPPYSSGGLHSQLKSQSTSKKYLNGKTQFPDFEGDQKDQRSFAFWSNLWLSEALRITKPG